MFTQHHFSLRNQPHRRGVIPECYSLSGLAAYSTPQLRVVNDLYGMVDQVNALEAEFKR